MSNAKRAAALITCIGMILVLFTSSAYIAHEAGHICVGEECEVCERIASIAAMAVLSFLAIELLLIHPVRKADFLQCLCCSFPPFT